MEKESTDENNTTGNLHKSHVSGSLPLTEEEIWDKIDWDMQQWGMGQGECESLLNEWKYRYKIALRNRFDEGNDR